MLVLALHEPKTQRDTIREATVNSIKHRDKYANSITRQFTRSLADAEEQVKSAIQKHEDKLFDAGKIPTLSGLKKLQNEIAEITAKLKSNQTLAFKSATNKGFKLGIYQGIDEFASAQLPFYRDLSQSGINKLTTDVFTLIDSDALDFLTNYNVVLAGDVNRELADGIKRTILTGLTTGKGAKDIVRDLGNVIEDKDSFRKAGGKVFSKAQYRMEMIARTEMLRAHNQGRMKFYEEVGVQRLEWLTMEDERTCPVCSPLHGEEFAIDKFPQQPAHPHCRCSSIVAYPVDICGAKPETVVAAKQGSSCILPPQVITNKAAVKKEYEKKLTEAFKKGSFEDLSNLKGEDLRTLAKGNGISVARTKAERLALLKELTGIDYSHLKGKELAEVFKHHKIGALRTKPELVKLLSIKQTEIKELLAIQQQQKKVSGLPKLDDLSAKELKELCKKNGISLNLTKQDTIELLDLIEPGIDHTALKGKELAAMKQKFNLPVLKNKKQLIDALNKHAGQGLAQKEIEQKKKTEIAKKKEAISKAVDLIKFPSNPAQGSEYLNSVMNAETALSEGVGVDKEFLDNWAKQLAKQKLQYQDFLSSKNSSELKNIVKTAKLPKWQWMNKSEMITLLSETDSVKVEATMNSVKAKWGKWAQKHGSKSKQTPTQSPAKTEKAKKGKQPVVKPKIPAPPVPNQEAKHKQLDEHWKSLNIDKHFKFKCDAKYMGGMHSKEIYTDPEGNEWLFKPMEAKLEKFRTDGEEAAYKLARLVDESSAIEVRAVTIKGRTGSIQQLKKGLKTKSDFKSISPDKLSKSEIRQIQREQVIDWLISNHDGHNENFLRGKDGIVYGIDKGQAWKFLGKDKLDISYHPNHVHGTSEPYYNTLFRAAKKGEVEVDPNAVLKYIKNIEAIDEQTFGDIVAPYINGRTSSKVERENLLQLMLDRKKNVRRDFEKFYGDITGKQNFKFTDSLRRKEKDAFRENGIVGQFTKKELDTIEAVKGLGWQGKTIDIDSEDIEDQNVLVFVEKKAGKTRTVLKFKVRPDADKRLVRKLKKGSKGRQDPRFDEDDANAEYRNRAEYFHNTVEIAVKNVNHHSAVDDGNYNLQKIEAMQNLMEELKEIYNTPDIDEDVRNMSAYYMDWIDATNKALRKKTSVRDGEFMGTCKIRKKAIRIKKKDDDGEHVIITTSDVKHVRREVKQGVLTVESEGVSNSTIIRNARTNGSQFNLDFGEGSRGRYIPWTDDNFYAQRGDCEITIDGEPDPAKIQRALMRLEGLGLNTKSATPEDTEYLYLVKQAVF